MILDDIVAYTRERLKVEKEQVPEAEFIGLAKEKIQVEDFSFPFEQALKRKGMNFICEVKKASPSKGVIALDFDYIQIAKDYEEAGASCISVLTEPKFFQGDLNYLKEISQVVKIPLLRKDFILEPYQIYQAKAMGASAVLLICAVLDHRELKEYLSLCNELGLSALVEIHDEAEAKMALDAGARIIGVNNRNLKDFTVDLNLSIQLRPMIPEEVVFVAESGIQTSSDIKELYKANVNGVLIGETMMRSKQKKEMLQELIGEIE